MATLYVIELESEVRSWLELLPGRLYRKVEVHAGLLAELDRRHRCHTTGRCGTE
jgi:hypothetical protein